MIKHVEDETCFFEIYYSKIIIQTNVKAGLVLWFLHGFTFVYCLMNKDINKHTVEMIL